jgi:predicted nucleotidyltransferase
MTMLDLKSVNLGELSAALEDHSYENTWWLDPETGEVVLWNDYAEEEGEPDPEERGLRPIEPTPSGEGYGDMEDFIELVRDIRARGLLGRAIEGRGAFRRFKDTLFEFPELREAWFRFHDVRLERRAIEWLVDEGLVAEEAASKALDERPDPELPGLSGPLDAEEVARAVAGELRELYGGRLRGAFLFGSWARGDAHAEADIDLLVVLDRVESVWEELRQMDGILWRHSFENDTIVSALVIDEARFREPEVPAVMRAKIEGLALA